MPNATYRLMAGIYDLTPELLQVETWRGRDYASMLTGRSSAGTIDVTLLNRKGHYSGGWSINQGDAITLEMHYLNGVKTLWSGRVDEINASADLSGLPTAKLTGIGNLSVLVEQKPSLIAPSGFHTSDYVNALTNTTSLAVITQLLTGSGLTFSIDSANGSTPINRWFADGSVDRLEEIRRMEDTDQGFLYELGDGSIKYEGRHARMKQARSINLQGNFSDRDGAILSYRDISRDNPMKFVYNRVTIPVTPYAVEPESVLWELADVPTIIQPNSFRKWVVPKPDAAAYVDNWITPNDSDVSFGGTFTLSNPNLLLTVVRYSNSAIITIQNFEPVNQVIVNSLRIRGTAVIAGDTTNVIVENTASQTKYKRTKEYAYPGPWLPSITYAESYGNHILSRYKDPMPVVSLTLLLNRNEAHMLAGFNREISDRVYVRAIGPTTRLNVDGEYFIEAIRHSVRSQFEHEVTFDLSPAQAYTGYWRIGTSKLGSETRFAY